MSFIRLAIAFTTLCLGLLLLVVAYANLYNIDEQPRSILAAYAVLGLLSIAVGVTVLVRGKRRPAPKPPAL